MKNIKLAARFFAASLTLVACALFLCPRRAHAMRMVNFQIRVDGKLALFGFTGDEGTAPDGVWEYLKTIKFKRHPMQHLGAKGGYAENFEVKPDADNPLTATLTGNLSIVSRYGGTAELTSLKLVRANAKTDEWQLAPGEVERTFKLRK